VKNIVQITALVVLTTVLFNPVQAPAQFFILENRDVGKEVQDFTLKMLSGRTAGLKKLIDGRRAAIFFWATWCPHCGETLRMLTKTKEDIKKKNIEIILIDVGETEAVVREYIDRHKIEFDSFLDEKSEVSEAYGLVGVPTFYFIDEEGIVKNVVHDLPEDLESGFSKP